MEVMNVRWKGSDPASDPAEIRQYGHTFKKGEWVKIQHDEKNPEHVRRISKFYGHPEFEVRGAKDQPDDKLLSNDRPPVDPTPARAPTTTYRVQGDKKAGFRVVDSKGNFATKDVYATAEDAQTVADALNAPKP